MAAKIGLEALRDWTLSQVQSSRYGFEKIAAWNGTT
jgi:hypothetical protein